MNLFRSIFYGRFVNSTAGDCQSPGQLSRLSVSVSWMMVLYRVSPNSLILSVSRSVWCVILLM